MTDRVVLFIDAQNTYRGARRSFLQTVTSRPDRPDSRRTVDLLPRSNREQSRAATGPDLHREAGISEAAAGLWRTHEAMCRMGASRRHCRPALRYPFSWPRLPAEEKGIDVALAIDFVMGAIDDAYHIGVIFSTDTDLRPALEVVATRFGGAPRGEVAAWRSPTENRRLSVKGKNVWCHFLDQNDYLAIHDPTDYNT